MSKREITIISLLILVFAGAYFLRKRDKVHYDFPKLPEIKAQSVDGLTLKWGETRLQIKKQNGKWVLEPEKIPVKKGFVDTVLESLKNLKFTALVSESGNYGVYQLDTEAVDLELYENGKKLLSLKVGKNSPVLSQTYVLLDGDEKVYQVEGDLRTKVKKTREEIIDKRVIDFDYSKAVKLAYDGKEKFSLTLKNGKWYFENGKQADEEKVKQVLISLSNLSAADIITDYNEKDFEKPEKSLTVLTDKEITLSVYGLKEKDYLCKSSQYPFPFTLTGTVLKTVFKNEKFFESKTKNKKEK